MAKVDPVEIAEVGDIDGAVRPGDQAARHERGVWIRARDELAENRAGIEVEFQNLAIVGRVNVLVHHQQQIADAEQASRTGDLAVRPCASKHKCSE